MDLKPGTKVTYKTDGVGKKGIVKGVQNDKYAFVVYHCNNNWSDYENYTAARTRIEDLEMGW